MPADGFGRRRFLAAGAALVGAVVLPGVAHADSAVAEKLSMLEDANNALIGVYVADLASGRSVAYRADERFAMCSTFKAYAAGRVLQMVDAGSVSLEQSMLVEPARVVDNSPITGPRAGTAMTLAELCKAALQHSDNTAGNLLLTTIGGPSAITAFARSLGDEQTRLDRWETELNSALPGDVRDTSTPAGLATGFRALLTGDALSASRRDQLTEWMRANQTSSLRAGLPAGWTSADKTGSGDYGSTNDVGVLFGPDGRRLVLAVMIRSRSTDDAVPGMRPLVGRVAALMVPE